MTKATQSRAPSHTMNAPWPTRVFPTLHFTPHPSSRLYLHHGIHCIKVRGPQNDAYRREVLWRLVNVQEGRSKGSKIKDDIELSRNECSTFRPSVRPSLSHSTDIQFVCVTCDNRLQFRVAKVDIFHKIHVFKSYPESRSG